MFDARDIEIYRMYKVCKGYTLPCLDRGRRCLTGKLDSVMGNSRHVIDARSTCRRPIMGDLGFRYHRYSAEWKGTVEGGSHVVRAPTRAQSARLNDPLIIVSRQISLVIPECTECTILSRKTILQSLARRSRASTLILSRIEKK